MSHLHPSLWLIIGSGAALILARIAFLSLREDEKRAACLSSVLAVGAAAVGGGLSLTNDRFGPAGLIALGALALVGLVLFLIPGRLPRSTDVRPSTRYDERDIPFSRVRLRPGTPEYESYYAMRPENRAGDDEIRSLPGLLGPNASLADPRLFASTEGSFFLTEALRSAVDGPVSGEKTALDPPQMTGYLKALARYFGAREVGIAELRPYHFYSHIGRGTGGYGEPIRFEPGYALAFTVEMDYWMTRAAPNPAAIMESGRQYVEAARIAVQLAAAIRAMGSPARAHIDGNYRVIAPLVARDAGLGEIGRMGLLMTPTLGPRVRLGLVTTSLELVPDRSNGDVTLIDFCETCLKCARVCPAHAVPDGGREVVEGVPRWRIDGDACFRYWNSVGTDCARCMAVCPYSHPDNAFHRAVRWGIRHSFLFRRAAVRLDDIFYGRKPPSHLPPENFRND